jgi:hypothetical protein
VDGRGVRETSSLAPHIVVLVALLALVSPLLDLDGAFISDEGSYVTQARALTDRGWDVGYAFDHDDPSGAFTPFHASVRSADGTFAYVDHPLWPALLAGGSEALGEDLGVRALGVVSLVLAAVVAWAIARAVSQDAAAPWAFWLAAASPLLASAWVTWAHVPSAVGGGLLVLGLLRAPDGARWVLVAAAGAMASVLLRSESLLWAAAACTAMVVVERSWRALRAGVVVSAAALLGLLIDGGWRAAIVGPAAPADAGSVTGDLAVRSGGASVADRLGGLRLTLVDGAFGSTSAKLVAVLGGVLALLAVLSWRSGRRSPPAGVLLVLSAAALALRVLTHPADPVPGLLLAAPTLLLAAVVPLRRELRWPLLAVGLFVAAIGATTYPEGGSLQWGGRYLSPALPVLAAAAGVGLAAALAQGGRRAAWLAGGAVTLMVVQAGGAVVAPDQLRRDTSAAVAVAVSAGPDVLLANGRQIARLDLEGWPDRCWLATPKDPSSQDVRDALDLLRAAEVRQVTYVGFDVPELLAAGATIVRREPGFSVGVLDIGGNGRWRPAEPYRCSGRDP